MPTCGFIRVQPDGMKEKDAGNRQRYDPVSKRMITTHPEIPPISKVKIVISQPVFMSDLFMSDYIVTFQGYSGCLNYGNEVTCSIYDQTGAQTATVTAKIANGLNTVVLNGNYNPGGYVYYASIQYGLSTFNSGRTQLIPELSILSGQALALSNTSYKNDGPFSFDSSFFWNGDFNLNFISSVRSDSTPATYKIINNSDSNNPVIITTGTFVPTYGNNSKRVSLQFITIPAGSGRTSVPYNPTEIFSAEIIYFGNPYRLPNLDFSSLLIQNVVLTITDSYWTAGVFFANFTLNYYLADNTIDVLGRRGGSVFESALNLYVTEADGAGPYLVYGPNTAALKNTGNFGNKSFSDKVNVSANVPLNHGPGASCYAELTYILPSLSGYTTTRSIEVPLLSPELDSSPTVSQFSELYFSEGTVRCNYTVEFFYSPRDGQSHEVACTLSSPSNSGVFASRYINAVVGRNTVLLENELAFPGDFFTAAVSTGGQGSTSVPIFCPQFPLFKFIVVEPFQDIIVSIAYDPDGIPIPGNHDVTLTWTNIIPVSNQNVIITPVGLYDIDGQYVDYTESYTGSSKTFHFFPGDNGAIEQTVTDLLRENGGFAPFQIKLTDTVTGISILSPRIRNG